MWALATDPSVQGGRLSLTWPKEGVHRPCWTLAIVPLLGYGRGSGLACWIDWQRARLLGVKWCLWPSWGSTGVQSFLVNIVDEKEEGRGAGQGTREWGGRRGRKGRTHSKMRTRRGRRGDI